MYNLTVNVFKIIRWAGPLPHAGFGGKGVSICIEKENKSESNYTIQKMIIINLLTTKEVRLICFERLNV